MEIYVPCSKISNLCGGNKFITQQETFFNIYKKNNPDEYKKLLTKLKCADRNEQNKILLKDISVYKEIQESIKSGDIKSRNTTLRLVEKKLKDNLTSKQIPESQQKIIIQNVKKQADFIMKTETGTVNEHVNLNKYENDNQIEITARNDETFKFYIKSEHVNLKICGKIDGINEKEKILIEHKQRMNRLFETIPLYEIMQMYLYMHFTSCNKAILIQSFGNEQNSMELEWSDDYFEILLNKIHKSLELYYEIVTNSKKLERLIKKYTVPVLKSRSIPITNFFDVKK